MSTSETEKEKQIFGDAMAALKAVYFVHKDTVSDRSILKMIARASVKMDVDFINKP